MSFLEEIQHLKIPFADIQLATDNFSTLIGKGGYGQVYKGQLLHSGILTSVAVKRLDLIAGQGLKEFLTEIHLLCRYKHPNLISLLGFCNEGNEKILVYEYAERGSLDKYLSDLTLTWMQRISICLDVARGLDYLHNQVALNQRVIHRDIKSANILLDHNWKAMISDLGLSKLGRANEGDTFLITNACGTQGYLDPNYMDTGILTKESDIYSLGVVLFEVLCGRLGSMNVNNEHRFLAPLAQRYYESKKLDEIMNPDLMKQMNINSKNMLSMIAYQCLHKDRSQRPKLDSIIKELLKGLKHEEEDGPYDWFRQNSYSSNDLPKTVVMTLDQGSIINSMDFHPIQQILLLVGSNTAQIMIWELSSQKKLVHKNFKIWDLGLCSIPTQASFTNGNTASIKRVTWSHDGTLFGVAYSKHMVQIYSYHGADDLRNHLEIEAHKGSVNDLSFSYPSKRIFIVTCGEDELIKVWDAVTGAKQYTFEGHEAPVYSICPHFRQNIHFIYSTSIDGKIKAWFYDNLGSRFDCDAPGRSSTTMAYNTDGTRLFSSGTNEEGESYIAEMNERDGAIKRFYSGLGRKSVEIVQFDTTKNRFLAAGDEFMVKFWDMDNVNLLTSTDADGGLPPSPCIRFNKEGILLAVSTNENGVKILASSDGIKLLGDMEKRPFDALKVMSASALQMTSPVNKNVVFEKIEDGDVLKPNNEHVVDEGVVTSSNKRVADRSHRRQAVVRWLKLKAAVTFAFIVRKEAAKRQTRPWWAAYFPDYSNKYF